MAAGATYEPIATTTLGSAAASITFSSIAATYTDLRVVLVGTTTATANCWLTYNSDSGTNYSDTILYGTGAAAGSNAHTTAARIVLNGSGNTNTTTPTFYTADIFSYAGSTYKTCLTTGSGDLNGSGDANSAVGLWRNTAAITTVTLTAGASTWKIGTTATLYGIKAA